MAVLLNQSVHTPIIVNSSGLDIAVETDSKNNELYTFLFNGEKIYSTTNTNEEFQLYRSKKITFKLKEDNKVRIVEIDNEGKCKYEIDLSNKESNGKYEAKTLKTQKLIDHLVVLSNLRKNSLEYTSPYNGGKGIHPGELYTSGNNGDFKKVIELVEKAGISIKDDVLVDDCGRRGGVVQAIFKTEESLIKFNEYVFKNTRSKDNLAQKIFNTHLKLLS